MNDCKKNIIHNRVDEVNLFKEEIKQYKILNILYEFFIRILMAVKFIIAIPIILFLIIIHGRNIFLYLSFLNYEEADEGTFIL